MALFSGLNENFVLVALAHILALYQMKKFKFAKSNHS